MNRPCEREAEILRGSKGGVKDPETEGHVASCASCRNALKASTFMRRLASANQTFPLPSALEIWSRAQFRQRNLAYQRALRPLKIFESIGWIVAAGGPAAWIAWKWPVIHTTISALQRGEITAVLGGGSTAAATLLWLVVAVAAASLLLTVNLIAADE